MVVVRNRVYAPLVTACCLVFMCIALCVPASNEKETLVRWGFFVSALYLALRAWRVGVIVQRARVIKRGWFRTRTIERSRIVAVQIRPYEGEIVQGASGGSDARLRMLVLKLDDQEVKLPELVGYSQQAIKLQSQLSEALGLPAPDLRPRHAASPG